MNSLGSNQRSTFAKSSTWPLQMAIRFSCYPMFLWSGFEMVYNVLSGFTFEMRWSVNDKISSDCNRPQIKNFSLKKFRSQMHCVAVGSIDEKEICFLYRNDALHRLKITTNLSIIALNCNICQRTHHKQFKRMIRLEKWHPKQNELSAKCWTRFIS